MPRYEREPQTLPEYRQFTDLLAEIMYDDERAHLAEPVWEKHVPRMLLDLHVALHTDMGPHVECSIEGFYEEGVYLFMRDRYAFEPKRYGFYVFPDKQVYGEPLMGVIGGPVIEKRGKPNTEVGVSEDHFLKHYFKKLTGLGGPKVELIDQLHARDVEPEVAYGLLLTLGRYRDWQATQE